VATGHAAVARANGGTIPGFANSGTVVGPGTSKSDSVLTRLSVGEEVVQEPYASRYRTTLKQINAGIAPTLPARPVASASQQPQQVTVSLAGAVIKATIDGKPITMMIQDQLVAASSQRKLSLSAGRQPGTL